MSSEKEFPEAVNTGVGYIAKFPDGSCVGMFSSYDGALEWVRGYKTGYNRGASHWGEPNTDTRYRDALNQLKDVIVRTRAHNYWADKSYGQMYYPNQDFNAREEIGILDVLYSDAIREAESLLGGE